MLLYYIAHQVDEFNVTIFICLWYAVVKAHTCDLLEEDVLPLSYRVDYFSILIFNSDNKLC